MNLKIYHGVEELQHDVNLWLQQYNETRPHSGKYCYGKTPMQTFSASKKLAQEKDLSILKLPNMGVASEGSDEHLGSIAPSTDILENSEHQGANWHNAVNGVIINSHLTDNNLPV